MGERQSIPLPTGSFELTVVLVGVSHPGNLGAICRCMLNYGFSDLRLVNPNCGVDDGDTIARAKHAASVLQQASIHESIGEATLDCSVVMGTSGKREVGDKTLFRHFVYPWEMVERLENTNQKAAIVFGEEGKGLSTEDLANCDFLVTLPTWEGYPIANLSHAVNAVLYEVQRHRIHTSLGQDAGLPVVVPLERLMNPELRSTLMKAIEQYSQSLSWQEERKFSFQQTLKRTLSRSMPTDDEATRLIGGLVEGTTAMQFSSNNPEWKKHHRRKLN
ncbi:MAG: RNA methyltransferase [Candidatus Poseidonia sp.]|nr:RNA methyltransferase [Poseidonia sp.]MBL6748579.1 RNA methyltransferase [Poseidonia sp.]MBL6805945.1 RNA methyltransferase [Poseidonia sp.]MBL6886830.1 RNA methyltransferase [Poseidonia sp.]MBL6892025.1 RNA methyltransferase [Poseidonia sp.]